LTQSVGRNDRLMSHSSFNKADVKRILVTRPNHRLGNLLLVTPLLQELENTFPGCKIDVFLKGGLGPVVLQGYENIDQIIALPKDHFRQLPAYVGAWLKLRKKKYDLVINVAPSSSSGRLSTKLSRASRKIFGGFDESFVGIDKDYAHLAKLPVCFFRSAMEKPTSWPPIPSLDIKLKPEEIARGKGILEKLSGSRKKTIAVFTYATGEKRLPKKWWKEF